MKHWLFYGLLTACILLFGGLPFESHDVGKLRPVETIFCQVREGTFCLETDTGDRGMGPDWEHAWKDLQGKAPGTVFLGTASYVLLDGESELPEVLKQNLNPSCGLCLWHGDGDLSSAGAYLRAHEPRETLRTERAKPGNLQTLVKREGGYLLVQ